jgi:hypothetical protein
MFSISENAVSRAGVKRHSRIHKIRGSAILPADISVFESFNIAHGIIE